MDIPDSVVGKFILSTTTATLLVLAFWVNTYPFIDDDISIYSLIPDPKWFLLFCAIWGVFFIGGLMSFTVYHIYPYI